MALRGELRVLHLSGGERVDDALYEQQGRIERELEEIRVRDIERALGVRSAQ